MSDQSHSLRIQALVRSACRRELAERSSHGTHIRLLWCQETNRVWLEVTESDEQVLAILVRPDQALDAFHHPYAYA